jgi:hypothetical protein
MSQERTSRQAYVDRVLELYRQAPETPARISQLDRHLDGEFYERQVGLEEVEAVILLATARRLLRNPLAPKLGPIRSLHYFVPVIEELQSTPVSESYLEYLRQKLEGQWPSGKFRC